MKGGLNNIKDFLLKTFLFSDIKMNEAELLLNDIEYTVLSYARGETVYSPEKYSDAVGFVVNGLCEVKQRNNIDGNVILNTLNPGDSFGFLAIFSSEAFPTYIYAKKNSEIVFLSKKSIEALIRSSDEIAINMIKFLSDRVSFLNKKISTVTKSSVDAKLAAFLLFQAKLQKTDEPKFNLKKCSESINAGRTSVYRSIDFLKNCGYITAENKTIKILNKTKLEELSK